MQINTESPDKLSHLVTVTIEPEDYRSEFKKKLNSLRQNADIKGFRRGKAPMSVIKRRGGLHAKAEILEKKMQETIEKYVEEKTTLPYGRPVVLEAYEDLTTSEDDSPSFKFLLGEVNPQDVESLYKDVEIVRPQLKIPPEKMDEYYQNAIDSQREYNEVDDIDGEYNHIELSGIPSDEEKAEEFSLHIQRRFEDFSPEYQTKFKAGGKGYQFKAALGELLPDASEEQLKAFIDSEEETEIDNIKDLEADFKIITVRKGEVPEENEEFFKKAFGPEVTSKEEAIEAIHKHLEKENEEVINTLFLARTREKLIEANIEMDLPEYFLTYSRDGKELSEKDREDAIWNSITIKFMDEWDVKAEEEDVRNELMQMVMRPLKSLQGQIPPEYMQSFVQQQYEELVKDQKNIQKAHERALMGILREEMEKKLPVKEDPMALEKLFDEYNTYAESLKEEE